MFVHLLACFTLCQVCVFACLFVFAPCMSLFGLSNILAPTVTICCFANPLLSAISAIQKSTFSTLSGLQSMLFTFQLFVEVRFGKNKVTLFRSLRIGFCCLASCLGKECTTSANFLRKASRVVFCPKQNLMELSHASQKLSHC